jgi:hypothetical protein
LVHKGQRIENIWFLSSQDDIRSAIDKLIRRVEDEIQETGDHTGLRFRKQNIIKKMNIFNFQNGNHCFLCNELTELNKSFYKRT